MIVKCGFFDGYRPGSSGVAQLLDDSETGSPKRGQGLRSFLQNKLATKQVRS